MDPKVVYAIKKLTGASTKAEVIRDAKILAAAQTLLIAAKEALSDFNAVGLEKRASAILLQNAIAKAEGN